MPHAVPESESPLNDVILEYLQSRTAGESPDRDRLLSEHPDLEVELRSFFENHDWMATVVEPDATIAYRASAEPQSAAHANSRRNGGDRRYVDLRPHARGGLGEVFSATDIELNRVVALKRLQGRFTNDGQSQRRFLAEAEITARLDHPGVVPVHSMFCDEDGSPCYAMRFIQGDTLADAVAGYRAAKPDAVTFRRLLQSFVQVCDTIAYAHSRGIIHRDLKPENIMLGKFGETLVVDWGLAKVIGRSDETPSFNSDETLRPASADGSDSQETQLGDVVGTPAYMSPEQAAGRWDVVGPATDIYGLGAVLYAVLTGRAPVEGISWPELKQRIQRGDLQRPRQVRRSVPRALEAICLKALALKPEDRYRSAEELAGDVERWLADESVHAYRDPMATRLGRWARRHKPVFNVAVALILAVPLIYAGWITRSRPGMVDRELGEEMRGQEAVARSYPPKGTSLVKAVKVIGEQRSAPFPRRGWFPWAPRKGSLTLKGHMGPVISVALSRNGRRIATSSRDRTVRIWDTATGQAMLTLRGHAGPINGTAFSRDGTWIVTAGGDGTVQCWDTAMGKAWRTFKGHAGPVNSVAISPDGRRVASGSADKTVKLWDVLTGNVILTLEGHAGPVNSVAFSRDGRRLASASADKTVKLWDVATGKVALTLEGHTGPVTSVAFSRDGRRLAGGSADKTIRLWDPVTGEEMRTLIGHTSLVRSIAFSTDGRRIASGSDDGTVKLWDAATGNELLTPGGHGIPVIMVAFSPDGKRIASTDSNGTVRVWDAVENKPGAGARP